MCKVPCSRHAGKGVTFSISFPEKTVFDSGLQECCALLALGQGWGAAAQARGARQGSTRYTWGAVDGVM